ncbi:MAG: DUF427 domain-containing protein [Pseudomonadota bacterium]
MANPAPGFNKHPDYEVRIEPLERELVVKLGDTEIARSQRAVTLHETRHRPVWYLPLEDVDARHIRASDTQTYCPFKGYASYWGVHTPDAAAEDAIWAYMAPYDECLNVSGYASFYTNKVDLYFDGELADKAGPGWIT